MDPKSPKFKKLQAEWYKKLRQSGFKDAEQADGNLKVWSSVFRLNGDLDKHLIKEEYYRRAGQFLHSYKFASEKERFIWEQHSEGKSTRTIRKICKEKKIKTHRDEIVKIIKQLVEKMRKTPWNVETL